MLLLVIISFTSAILAIDYSDYLTLPYSSLPSQTPNCTTFSRGITNNVIPQNGGSLPEDSFLLQNNGLLYAYGGGYLTVVNPSNEELITSIQLTSCVKLSRDSHFSLSYDYSLFCFDAVHNLLFCASENGWVYAINCTNNTIAYIIDDVTISSYPRQHRVVFDEQSSTLIHYVCERPVNLSEELLGVGRLSSYNISQNNYSINYTHTCDNDQEKIFDLILHFNTSVANERWLLYSTIDGDIMKLNCYSATFSPSVLISQNEIGLNRKPRGFSHSINPVTQTPEIICCTSTETSLPPVILVSINPQLSYEFIEVNSLGAFNAVNYAEYCLFNNKVYLWGRQYMDGSIQSQNLKIIDRTTLTLSGNMLMSNTPHFSYLIDL